MKIPKVNNYLPSFSTNAMADMAFLLLIFIVIFMQDPTQQKINYALTGENKKVEGQALTIYITPDEKYFLNGKEITLQHAEKKLVSAIQNNQFPEIRISADKDTPFIVVNKILHILKTLEYPAVSLVVEKDVS